ncbi:3968_t:CDS:2 [Racocetra fulgida]|uniref:3968_t:CDS:1 n=1 Tax=Racocetra fulgida TaxID=60492 RepID=A0A9N8VXD6_9GLOM|nr:3968_t:CDS:2 [Racocetra fulgida]
MPKSKCKNAAKEYILIQSRDNKGKFLKTIDTENSNSEYSDSELLIFESKNNNKKEFDNKIEPNEEAKQLINKDNSFYNLNDLDKTNDNSISEQLNKLNNTLNNMKHMNAYKYLHHLAVYKYLTKIFDYEKLQTRIKLSLEISQQIFQHSLWIVY